MIIKMTRKELRAELERMLSRAPEIMTPMKAHRYSPLGKNKVYELIKTGTLRSVIYQGGYLIAKIDLIDYLVDHCNDKKRRKFATLDDTEE